MTRQQLTMTFRQIILMNFGFFGIQYSFGLQQTAVNPIYSLLGAGHESLPLLNMAGPITGLIVQPIIGALSDRTWISPWGRRRPYFMIGAIGCSLSLFIFPHVTSVWMAALMLWILDISNNTAMEPYRAFVADALPEKQQNTGFLMQSMFTGLGITLANLSLYLFNKIPFLNQNSASGIPYWVYGSFYLGALCAIGSILISVLSTPEHKPSDQELTALKEKSHGFTTAIKDIIIAIKEMPKTLRQLALVYLFQWYALFIYWQFATPSIAKSVWHATPADKELYNNAISWTGIVNGSYNIVTFLSAFALMAFTKKYAAKKVHACAVSLAAIALLIFPHISNQYVLLIPMIGFGIAWASIMGVPFLIATAEIPRQRYGVYMGIINMMIVIPMFIETITFGFIYEHILNNNPTYAIMMSGVLLALAALFTLFIHTKQGQN